MFDRPSRLSRRHLLTATAAASTALVGCSMPDSADESRPDEDEGGEREHDGDETVETGPSNDSGDESPQSPLEADVDPKPLLVDLEVPWEIAFTPTDEVFVSERAGRLLRLDAETLLETADDPIRVGDVPDEQRQEWPGESIQGIAIHPSYPNPAYVYLYYNVGGANRVGRFDAESSDPEATHEVLLEGIAGDHTIGGEITFGPDGALWVTAGTAEKTPAQDPGSLGGTVLRLTADGEPSPDNPDIDGADPRVFSYGHRNPQGIAWLADDTPVCVDHGPNGRDEVTVLRPGANYGWPDVQGGPDDPEYESYDAHEDVAPPLVNTGPDDTWAPSACVRYTGDAIPEWRDRLLVGTLQRQSLAVLSLRSSDADAEGPFQDDDAQRFDAPWLDDAYTVTAHHLLENEFGRVRTVTQAPDGSVLLGTSNRDGMAHEPFPLERDDAIVQLRPS
ncbi:PQQ-dependent sugar dehydrogenase [Natronosalvus halobius]|uniref:PQQ-dependent sugar dehydrogenase n=1 Tax=Natronosalvus halobius TaxID=2953746 RepID=UPI0020A0FBC2|nr:PQQ-dependent sugar dehydrogenase [Natronosalvus halobius]USZ71547.1 PQQ-dependent sugar dehydrogenase [Natronosalvus halobius]